jgi:hypothetical protein
MPLARSCLVRAPWKRCQACEERYRQAMIKGAKQRNRPGAAG